MGLKLRPSKPVLSLRAGTRYFYPATVASGTGRKNKNKQKSSAKIKLIQYKIVLWDSKSQTSIYGSVFVEVHVGICICTFFTSSIGDQIGYIVKSALNYYDLTVGVFH
jgi:hypothetical protein